MMSGEESDGVGVVPVKGVFSPEQFEALEDNFRNPPGQVDEVVLELGKAKARKETTLLAWQRECLAQIMRRMPVFEVKEPVPIRLAGAGGYLGHAVGADGPITIAPMSYDSGERRCKETIKHELIHIHIARLRAKGLVPPREGAHGATFQKTARFLGLRNWGDRTWRWKLECRSCGYWVKTNMKSRSMCPHCRGKGKKSWLVVRDNVKVTREDRAAFTGKPLPEKAPKPPRNIRAERKAKAEADLKRWERKLKLATTKVKQLRKKVAYYEREAKA